MDKCNYCNEPSIIKNNGIWYCEKCYGKLIGWYREPDIVNSDRIIYNKLVISPK